MCMWFCQAGEAFDGIPSIRWTNVYVESYQKQKRGFDFVEKFISPRGEINDRGDTEMPLGPAEKFPPSFGYILFISEH